LGLLSTIPPFHLSTSFDEHHLLGAAIVPAFQAVEIDAAAQGVSPVVLAVPDHLMPSGGQICFHQSAHDLAAQVEDADPGGAWPGKVIADGGAGVEGIGVVAPEPGNGGKFGQMLIQRSG